MLAGLCVRVGIALLGNRPPDGRAYWATRWWDRDAVTCTPGLAPHFARHREIATGLIGRYAASATSVLEIACGTGEFTELAARVLPRAHITGVDISLQALMRARDRLETAAAGSRVSLYCGDFADVLPGVPDVADLVLCFDAVHHLGAAHAVLRQLRGRVAPGGALIGNVWTADHFHEFGRHRYGAWGHLRHCMQFMAAAAILRVTGWRVGRGFYRTQLITADEAEAQLRELFGQVEVVRLRYHLVFVACP